MLSVAVAATFIGKDSVQQIIDAGFEHVYEISLEVVKRMGRFINDDASALKLRKRADKKTEITVSARKYMLPKPDVAGGVLYQILDKVQ